MSKFEWQTSDVEITPLPDRLQKVVDKLPADKTKAAERLQRMVKIKRITLDDLTVIISSGVLAD